MGSMVNQGVATFIEVGPGRALSNIARRFSDNFRFLTVEDANSDDLASLGAPPFDALRTPLENHQPA
jgi:malonyl CoA-acyl carrier protein transacylase